MVMMETLAGEPICPHCNSLKVKFNKDYGFYQCESCGATWAFDEDDPDYEEDFSDENREVGGIWGFRNTNTGETWDNYE